MPPQSEDPLMQKMSYLVKEPPPQRSVRAFGGELFPHPSSYLGILGLEVKEREAGRSVPELLAFPQKLLGRTEAESWPSSQVLEHPFSPLNMYQKNHVDLNSNLVIHLYFLIVPSLRLLSI